MEHPGLLYVAATLLSLVAVLLLFLAGGLRAALRPVRDQGGLGASLYRLLGGDTPTPVGAYVATAAIAGAFVLSLTGFILHAQDLASHGQHAAAHVHEEGAGGEHKH